MVYSRQVDQLSIHLFILIAEVFQFSQNFNKKEKKRRKKRDTIETQTKIL
jgi:hypothetical protein